EEAKAIRFNELRHRHNLNEHPKKIDPVRVPTQEVWTVPMTEINANPASITVPDEELTEYPTVQLNTDFEVETSPAGENEDTASVVQVDENSTKCGKSFSTPSITDMIRASSLLPPPY
ncbi:hypothetical protein PMAYCL1PPCAC_01601, partial [Pristionchus mayeri]